MRTQFLRIYDKIILTAILAVLGLLGCNRKTYPEKQTEHSEQNAKQKADSVRICDTIIMPKNPHDRVIALYGVRPTQLDK